MRCLTPGCPKLTTVGSRCPTHTAARQRQRDLVRGSRQERGYDRDYDRNRRAVLADGPHVCAWCHVRLATTVDHLVPLARGGTNAIENLVPACARCNSSRGSAMSDWRPPR